MSTPVTIEDIYQLFQKSQAEADRRFAEADRRRAEFETSLVQLEKTVERTAKAVDGLTTRWGRFVEEWVEPAVIRLFQERGIDIRYTYSRAKNRKPGLAMEIDILAVNDTVAVLVECKSRLSHDVVNDFLQKLAHFKESFPLYQNYRTHGAVAGIEIDEGVDNYAYRKGLFVIRPSGDTVAIVNDPKFRQVTW